MIRTLYPIGIAVVVVFILAIGMVIRIFRLLARSLKKAPFDQNIGRTKPANSPSQLNRQDPLCADDEFQFTVTLSGFVVSLRIWEGCFGSAR